MKRVFFIVGPTATGKSEIAAEIACQLNAEIINADELTPSLLRRAKRHGFSDAQLAQPGRGSLHRGLLGRAAADRPASSRVWGVWGSVPPFGNT